MTQEESPRVSIDPADLPRVPVGERVEIKGVFAAHWDQDVLPHCGDPNLAHQVWCAVHDDHRGARGVIFDWREDCRLVVMCNAHGPEEAAGA